MPMGDRKRLAVLEMLQSDYDFFQSREQGILALSGFFQKCRVGCDTFEQAEENLVVVTNKAVFGIGAFVNELQQFVEQATWIAVNDYEGQMLKDRTGLGFDELAERVSALVVTRGGEGSVIYADGDRLEIPAVQAARISDPTGCGDAYRAGLLYGLSRDWPWADTGRLAALIGARKIEHKGTQNHRYTRESLAREFVQAFGYAIEF